MRAISAISEECCFPFLFGRPDTTMSGEGERKLTTESAKLRLGNTAWAMSLHLNRVARLGHLRDEEEKYKLKEG